MPFLTAEDTAYAEAAVIVPRQLSRIHLILVGAGGSGSWTAPDVCRLAAVLRRELGKEVRVTIIDPDRVETANVPRSNFSYAEVGLPKALTLARRYGAAWGLEVTSIEKHFERAMAWTHYDGTPQLTVLIGCVDNPAARRELHLVLRDAALMDDVVSNCWYIDAGNGLDTGQVVIGNSCNLKQLRGAFPCSTICQAVPAPALQFPDLIRPALIAPQERASRLSCRELMLFNEQSLVVNRRVATEIGDFLMRLLLTNDLQRFATLFNLHAGTTTSSYVTPEMMARALGKPASIFLEDERKRRAAWQYSYLEEAA